MREVRCNIVLRSEPGGRFTRDRKRIGCVTCGRTVEEPKKMAKDAIDCYIESLKKQRGRPTDWP